MQWGAQLAVACAILDPGAVGSRSMLGVEIA